MNVLLKRIAEVNRKEKWDNHITNDDISENLVVTSVEGAASVSRLRWIVFVQTIQGNRLPKKMLFTEVPGVRDRGRPRKSFFRFG